MPRQIAAGVGPLTVAGKVVRAVIWLDWGICAVIYGIMLNRVESVVISGFIIALCGLALLVIGMCLPFRPVGWVGLSNCIVALVFLTSVLLFGWGPSAARVPFDVMGAGYLLGSLMLIWRAHRKAPRKAEDRCRVCGYLLIGLPEPRCPECGTPFDPSSIPGDFARGMRL